MSVHFLLFSVQVPSSNSDSLFSVLMSFISHLTFIFFLISNVCLANISKDFKTKTFSFERHQQCRSVGEICQQNNQCCSPLTCSMLQGNFDAHRFDHRRLTFRKEPLFTIVERFGNQTSIGRSDHSTLLQSSSPTTTGQRTRYGFSPW